MDFGAAIQRILLGSSLADVALDKRRDVCVRQDLDFDDPASGQRETAAFMRDLCRELGDRHAGDKRIASALLVWVNRSPDYEAWDALMSGFEFEGRTRLAERGRRMFPGTMTAHWPS